VDAVTALVYEVEQFVDPSLASIVQLARRSRTEAAGVDRENQGAERLGVAAVEPAIDRASASRVLGPSTGKTISWLSASDFKWLAKHEVGSLPGPFAVVVQLCNTPSITTLRSARSALDEGLEVLESKSRLDI
jgi:hypothetical protein